MCSQSSMKSTHCFIEIFAVVVMFADGDVEVDVGEAGVVLTDAVVVVV